MFLCLSAYIKLTSKGCFPFLSLGLRFDVNGIFATTFLGSGFLRIPSQLLLGTFVLMPSLSAFNFSLPTPLSRYPPGRRTSTWPHRSVGRVRKESKLCFTHLYPTWNNLFTVFQMLKNHGSMIVCWERTGLIEQKAVLIEKSFTSIWWRH